MVSPIRKVALVGGSGRLGPHLLAAISGNPMFDLTVITRAGSSAQFPAGTNVVRVPDSYPDEDMVHAFTGQDAVVLSLSHAAEHRHAALADASKKAGVRRLIASVYAGHNTKEVEDIFPFAANKVKIINDLRTKEAPGWSWTAIHCGFFFDFCIATGFFGFNPSTHTATIWDDGKTTFSATNFSTIGYAVSRVLEKLDETSNRSVYISSFEPSLNSIFEAYKEVTGVQDWTVTYVNSDEEIKKAKEEAKTGSMFAIGKLALATGVKEDIRGNFVAEGLSDNELLEISRESIIDTVSRVLKKQAQ